ncbi:MAG: DUF3795 domain-containing protein [Erysipelotrichaceae bacterium]|nr:DUF3795 domain-containing protein [Erysipelotrichaceae bacterium]
MKRELGIGRCGLACCLCSENSHCKGCNSGDCPDKDWCFNRRCSLEKGIGHCYECSLDCHQGLLGKIKPYGFTLYAKRYGEEKPLDKLEENERKGIVYHREGIKGDYDDFDDVEELIEFIDNGTKGE